MTEPCSCKEPGFCERHSQIKTDHLFKLCQTNRAYRSSLDKNIRNNCKYRGKRLKSIYCQGCNGKVPIRIYECSLFKKCAIRSPNDNIDAKLCRYCNDYEIEIINNIKVVKPKVSITKKSKVTSLFSDKEFNDLPDLIGKFQNQCCFFIGSGPSLLNIDLNIFQQRGIVTFATNNVAAKTIRPNFWCCVDHPKSFHESIFFDPFITKFIPRTQGHLHFHLQDSGLNSNIAAKDCPNTYLYDLRTPARFNHETFLTEEKASYGTEPGIKDSCGLKGSRSVMLAALKIMFCLGFRTIFLVGCDFNMQHDPKKIGKGNTYAFEQYKHPGGCASNNKSFKMLNTRFEAMKDHFKVNGFNVFNCTINSKLDVFPFSKLQDAINLVTRNIPRKIETFGYYGGKENKNKHGW